MMTRTVHLPSAPEIPKRSDVTHREHQTEPRLRHTMKWKNVDIGPEYYYITGTVTQWLPQIGRIRVGGFMSAGSRSD